MPARISVGPPTLTINQGSTFVVTAPDGRIAADSEQGVFSDDTRFLSYYEIFANGTPWILQTSSAVSYYAARICLTNPAIPTEQGEIPEGTLSLVIGRAVCDGIHEDLDVVNYGQTPVRFNLEIALRSDFADVFEVKTRRFVRRGRITTEWDEELQELWTSYSYNSFERRFCYRLCKSGSRAVYANGRISLDVELAPAASWHACGHFVLVHNGDTRLP